MAKKEKPKGSGLTPSEELDYIRSKDELTYLAFKNLLKFFITNSKILSEYKFEFDGIDDASEEKKEADSLLKFAKDYDHYFTLLDKYREELGKELTKKAEREVDFKGGTGVSVEEVVGEMRKKS